MSAPFLINDHLVDPSRNQIILSKKTIDVPPKAISVLTLLAKNAGRVVSHDELMEKVWPNAVVGPNTLQRSITQLRKALGDDSKQQNFIKTHAKQGYSLTGAVKWQPESMIQPSIISTNYWTKSYWLLVPIILIFFTLWPASEEVKLNLTNVRPITATDRNEINARYSPDGQFLVFKRNSHSCLSHLWAKNLISSEEFQLTKSPGVYGSVDWSEDGNQLAFTSQNICNKAQNIADKCWQLKTLDFSLSLRNPIEPVSRFDCNKNRVAVARWVEKGDIALIVSGNSSGNQLQSHDLKTGEHTVIYAPINKKIYSYDYDSKQKVFAVISTTDDNQHRIEKVDLTGRVISTALIQLGNKHSVYEYYNVYFHPSGNFLITYTELGLFLLDFEGRITRPNYDVLSQLIYPNFHPKENKLVATHLSFDSDIALLKPSTSEGELINVIARSNAADVNAQFQPGGNAIAFVSNRTGSRQLWLLNNNKVTQISHQEMGLQSKEFFWSPTGNEIAIIEGDQVVVYGLDKKRTPLKSVLPIKNILQWPTNDEILLIAKEDNQLFTLGVHNRKLTELGISNIQMAQTISEGRLFYISHDKAFIQHAEKVSELLELPSTINLSKIILKQGKLFGINSKKQLWSFDLSSNKVNVLNSISKPNALISDARDGEFLFTFIVTSKKELLEFNIHD